MIEYTGSRVFRALRIGYASSPEPAGIPQEPPLEEYIRGVIPLDTLPAPYWNWFISSISNNDNRVAPALKDIYDSLDAIMTEGQQAYTGQADDLLNALAKIIDSKITFSDKKYIGDYGSWAMFTLDGGYYYWDVGAKLLSYFGPGPEQTGNGKIKWMRYTVSGGNPDFTITGGTRLGVRDIWAEDNDGVIRHYYTEGKTDASYEDLDEIAVKRLIDEDIEVLSDIRIIHVDILDHGVATVVPMSDYDLPAEYEWSFVAQPSFDYPLFRCAFVIRVEDYLNILLYTDTNPYTQPILGSPLNTSGEPILIGEAGLNIGSFTVGDRHGGSSTFPLTITCFRSSIQ